MTQAVAKVAMPRNGESKRAEQSGTSAAPRSSPPSRPRVTHAQRHGLDRTQTGSSQTRRWQPAGKHTEESNPLPAPPRRTSPDVNGACTHARLPPLAPSDSIAHVWERERRLTGRPWPEPGGGPPPGRAGRHGPRVRHFRWGGTEPWGWCLDRGSSVCVGSSADAGRPEWTSVRSGGASPLPPIELRPASR